MIILEIIHHLTLLNVLIVDGMYKYISSLNCYLLMGIFALMNPNISIHNTAILTPFLISILITYISQHIESIGGIGSGDWALVSILMLYLPKSNWVHCLSFCGGIAFIYWVILTKKYQIKSGTRVPLSPVIIISYWLTITSIHLA